MSTRNGVRARKNKERSKNFTELEKRTVLELINQHREVLRQGRSNNATNRSKQLVWSQICAEVNKRCHAECPRTPAQVKMWYENYKKKCKMRFMEPGAEDTPSMIDGILWQNLPPLLETVIKDERDSVPLTYDTETNNEHLPINMSNDRSDERLCEIKPIEAFQLVIHKDRPPLPISRSSGAPSPIALNYIKPDSPSPLQHTDIRAKLMPLMPAHHSSTSCVIPQESSSNMPLNLSNLDHNIPIDPSSPQDDGREPSPSYSNINFASRHNLPSSQIFPNKKHPKPRGIFSRAGSSQDNCCDRTSIPDTNLPHSNNLGNYCNTNTSPTEEEKLYYLTKRQHAIFEHDLRMKTLNMELRYKEEVFSLQKQLFLIELKLKMDFLEKNCSQ